MARSNPQLSKLYFPVMKVIQRHWPSRLSSTQYIMLGFINERTLRFGKISERLTIRQAMTGIVNQATEEVIHGGTGLKKTAIIDALKALEDRGLIHQEIPLNGSPKGRLVTIDVAAVLEPAQNSDVGTTKRQIRRRRKDG